MVTFDGQRFVFDGDCEYILATVRLGPGLQGAGLREFAWWAPPQRPPPHRMAVAPMTHSPPSRS